MADTKVRDVMTNLVVMLYPKDSIHEAAQRLAKNGISGAPVVEAGKVVGIVSESDLIHAVMPPVPVNRGASVLDLLALIGRPHMKRHDLGKIVADVMSTSVVEASPDMSVWQAAATMERKGIKRLPVVDDDDYLLGIISRADLIKAMARDDDRIQEDVVETIDLWLGLETIDSFEVKVTDGVAFIKGTADRSSTRTHAVELVGRVPGVVEVIDRMSSVIDDKHIGRPRVEADPKDPRLDWHDEEAVNRGSR